MIMDEDKYEGYRRAMEAAERETGEIRKRAQEFALAAAPVMQATAEALVPVLKAIFDVFEAGAVRRRQAMEAFGSVAGAAERPAGCVQGREGVMKCARCDRTAVVILQTEDRTEHAACTADTGAQVVDLIDEYGEGAPVFLYLAEGQ